MEVCAADTASWITIKSNVCKMFPFDSFKRFSDLVEYIEGGKMSGSPDNQTSGGVLRSVAASQREAENVGKDVKCDGNYCCTITQKRREP